MTADIKARQKALIGSVNDDFWLYDSETGFDLTRPTPPTRPPVKNAITLQTTTSPITIDPVKSALVIIDMQNFFLSPAIGRPADSKWLQAQGQLVEQAIPAAREAGIQVVWLNWGLSDQDLISLPPSVFRAFGFNTLPADEFDRLFSVSASTQRPSISGGMPQNDVGKDSTIYKGLGQTLENVSLPDGRKLSAGRMLMRDQWNTELSSPLQRSFQLSSKSPKPDVWLNKNRISGLHVPESPAALYFQAHGTKTLFFAGVNTDQCVNATLADAFAQGYDCVLLKDGCATTSPHGAQECVEYNVARTMGFVVDCQGFARDIEASIAPRSRS